jgi:hypothetical protein
MRTPQNRVWNKLPTSPTTEVFRVRNTGLQIKIKIYFDDFLFMLDVLQYLLLPIKGLEARSNIYIHHANFGYTSAGR